MSIFKSHILNFKGMSQRPHFSQLQSLQELSFLLS